MKTYDIINAGPDNRFMANGRIVSNSGAIVQLQNLFRNSLSDLDGARSLVAQGNYEALAMLYDSIPEVLAQCVRTAFIPMPGHKFIVADFSAIEARVIAWVAGEQWRMDAFAQGKDIYCASASQMFGVPVEKHGINGHLRQKGKIAELALGFGGSKGALTNMGALDMGLKEDELDPLVKAWRAANPNIVRLWWTVDRAAKTAIKERTTTKTHGLTFTYQGGMMYITLPSGRQLSYVKPRMGENRFGGESITYMGNDFTKHWSRIETFGGKLVENCIAEGTLVITDHGLVPIENISSEMLVWDGEDWVSHDGLICQGIQKVVDVNGILMTPDHKILTEGGWCCAKQAKSIAPAKLPNCVVFPPNQVEITNREMMNVYDIRNAGPRHRFTVWNGERALIVSNCIQAISRDILCFAMRQLKDYRIVAHVHDEVIIEAEPDASVEEVCRLMATVPPWAPGLILRADGYECEFYQKDT